MLTDNQKIFLAQSAEFQKLLAEDPILCELEAQQYDPQAEFYSLMEMLRGTFTIGKSTIQPLTPAVWAFLWGIGNRYTIDLNKVTEIDTDIFLFVLANGVRRLNCSPAELPAAASGSCPAMGLDYRDAFKELTQVIHAAFRPLEMMPKTTGGQSAPPQYDAYWLAQLCSIVAGETNEKATELMFTMPLSSCYYYLVNYNRKNAKNGDMIRRRTPEEIQKGIFDRVNVLAEDFCSKHYGGV